jgi:hypothetical protein
MTIERILSELQTAHKTGDKGDALLTPWEIGRWSDGLQVKPVALYDLLALRLAVGFHRGELAFEFCDKVMNDLYHVAISSMDEWGDWQKLFWSVYTAFDEGEYHHDNDRAEDPVEKYTRPMIADIVAEHGYGIQ